MIGIVVSEADSASTAIGKALLDENDWEEVTPTSKDDQPPFRADHFELRYFDDLHLTLEEIDSAFSEPEMIVFVSRHAGETGPLLTTHFPGNVGKAQYGGEPHSVPKAAPRALSQLYAALKRTVPADFDIGIECTHHGPSSIDVPCCFVELGSGPQEWEDDEAARAVAKAVLSLDSDAHEETRAVVGIGGGHYAPRFERIIGTTGWSVGHIAADWALEEVTNEELQNILDQLFTQSDTTLAVLDGDCPRISSVIDELGYDIVSETWIRETDGISLSLVSTVEEQIGSIDDGTRFGDRVHVGGEQIHVGWLSNELIEAAERIDRKKAGECIAANTTAYGTREGGNRLRGDIVVSGERTPTAVAKTLLPLLEQGYDDVMELDEHVILRKRRFDPKAAQRQGIPEGPLFGKLAKGESIEHEGSVVTPADVMAEQTEQIPLLDK